MEKEIDLKTAIQIAKIVCQVPEERMPIIWDIFSKAGLDIGGLDEMAEWKSLTRQTGLIDTEKFLTEITEGRTATNGEFRIRIEEFNDFCAGRKLSARCVRKHLADTGAIRTGKLATGKVNYTCTVVDTAGKPYRAVCIYEDWKRSTATAEGGQQDGK